MLSNFIIVTSCFEDISKNNYYSNCARKLISYFSKDFNFLIHTNNKSYFSDLNCKILETNTIYMNINEINLLSLEEKNKIDFQKLWTLHDKLVPIEYALNSLNIENILFLDCDDLPLDNFHYDTFLNFVNKLEEYEQGIHFTSYWGDKLIWKYLKKEPYFEYFKKYVSKDFLNSSFAYNESIFFVKKFSKFNDFCNLVLNKYKNIMLYTDLFFYKGNEFNGHRPPGRAEGLSFSVAIFDLNMKNNIFINDDLFLIGRSLTRFGHPDFIKLNPNSDRLKK
jgi:hypothetical protein